ncbi:MAG: DUF4982 domain-containing protein [Clostridia bacterium]|nr:DUF4982 domain-containing protein [Clostridia bacterium]
MRTRELFCDGWLFHRGDIKMPRLRSKGPTYSQSKTERYKSGPASIQYGDTPDAYAVANFPREDWEYVCLPHDYVINGIPDKNENCTLGYLKYENAWYRKHFTLSDSDKGKRIIIEFEGVSGNSTVYLNGCLMKHNFCAYTSYEVDITDYAICGGENVIAVYCDLTEFEGWWYEGGGIYRNVWLLKTDEIAVDTYGVYVDPKKIDQSNWIARFETTLVSSSAIDEEADIITEIIDNNGNTVSTAKSNAMIPSHSKTTVEYSSAVASPHLWDIDDPYLYNIKTTVIRNKAICDVYFTRTGFRYFTCDSENGFFLNGKHIKIKGVCAHEDCGLLGKAVPANVHRYKMKLLKEMGANGYRTSHYQQNTFILDALDELGFIVLNETRWFSSTDEGIAQLEALVKRDRNRPSVFFWSLSNEEHFHLTDQGRKITQTLMRALRRLDRSRPITSAVSESPNNATVFDELDIIGINYNLNLYDEIHEKYPQKAIFSSENCATGSSRAWYYPDCRDNALFSAYDKDTNSWFQGRERTWKFIDERDWVMGGYQWAGFEHRGETVWPRLCSQSGAIDLFLQKKDAFYQNRSLWSTTPNIHILPHWNIECYDGEKVRVWVYTNCNEGELFLNGKSLGRKTVEKNSHLEWMVDYEPGRIEAIGYINGKACASEYHETASTPERLMLRLENEIASPSDVAIISCYCLDKEGRFVPNADPLVSFHSSGIGRIISTGSDICDHTPIDSTQRKMRAGYISVAAGVAIERGCHVSQHGTIEIYAHSQGLKSARLQIKI